MRSIVFNFRLSRVRKHPRRLHQQLQLPPPPPPVPAPPLAAPPSRPRPLEASQPPLIITAQPLHLRHRPLDRRGHGSEAVLQPPVVVPLSKACITMERASILVLFQVRKEKSRYVPRFYHNGGNTFIYYLWNLYLLAYFIDEFYKVLIEEGLNYFTVSFKFLIHLASIETFEFTYLDETRIS